MKTKREDLITVKDTEQQKADEFIFAWDSLFEMKMILDLHNRSENCPYASQRETIVQLYHKSTLMIIL